MRGQRREEDRGSEGAEEGGEKCECKAALRMLSAAHYPWLDAVEGVADVDLVFRANGCECGVRDVSGGE